jgi:STE24 endopeptidase
LLGGLDTLHQALLAWLGGGMVQQLALLAAFALINGVIDLPLTLYQTFVLEQRYGFNQMTLRLWLADLAKSLLLGGLIGLPIAAAVLWLMGSAGGLWWLWAWGLWMGFNLLLMVVYPVFIAPLFNKFEPLADASLTARVTALMQRCGFQAKGLFVMDGSRRSAHANAYFTGLGSAKRVVFFDTLLKQLSPAEVEAVLAHELGHFHHRHIVQRMVMMFALSLAGFALLGWLSAQPWFYAGLGVRPSLALLVPGAPSAPHDALAFAAVHAGSAGVHGVPLALVCTALAPPRVPGRRLRHGAGQRRGSGLGPAQAVRGQCLHAHARPAVREIPLLAPPRQRAAGAHALPHYRMTSMLKQKDWSTQARRALTAPEL